MASTDAQRLVRGLSLVAQEIARLQFHAVNTTTRSWQEHGTDLLSKLPAAMPAIMAARGAAPQADAQASGETIAPIYTAADVPLQPVYDVVAEPVPVVETVPAPTAAPSVAAPTPAPPAAAVVAHSAGQASAAAAAAQAAAASVPPAPVERLDAPAPPSPATSAAATAPPAATSATKSTVAFSAGAAAPAPAAAAAQPVVAAATPAPAGAAAPAAAGPVVSSPKRKRVFREVAVPASPLARVWGFGSLAASMALGAAGEALSRTLGGSGAASAAAGGAGTASGPAPKVVMSEAQAEKLAEGLCRMRGAALKIGQMLSLSDESLLPPQIAAVLERVRTQADIMPKRQLDQVMREELGPDWRAKLGGDNFEEVPVAAASIGQVHRSVLPDGTKVAIKVQYPGVAESINSDIGNLGRLLSVANFMPKGLYIDSLMEVAREELTAECDYRREADAQDAFGALVGDDAEMEVPRVIRPLSTRRVLVSTWLDGMPIDQVVEQGYPQEVRDRIARKLLRLTLKELFEWRYMQTDPNWGNFFYNPAADKIGLLDFGAARAFRKEFVDDYLRLVWAAANKDRDGIRDISVKLGLLTGLETKVMMDAHIDSGLVVGEPFATPEPFDFKASGMTKRVVQYGGVFAEHRLTPPPTEVYSLHRKLAGAFFICIRMGAVMRCRDMLEETWTKHKFGPV